jgi:hypothetical protein
MEPSPSLTLCARRGHETIALWIKAHTPPDTFDPILGCRIAVLLPSRPRFIELGEAIAWW